MSASLRLKKGLFWMLLIKAMVFYTSALTALWVWLDGGWFGALVLAGIPLALLLLYALMAADDLHKPSKYDVLCSLNRGLGWFGFLGIMWTMASFALAHTAAMYPEVSDYLPMQELAAASPRDDSLVRVAVLAGFWVGAVFIRQLLVLTVRLGYWREHRKQLNLFSFKERFKLMW